METNGNESLQWGSKLFVQEADIASLCWSCIDTYGENT